jgi:hypothetical protein
MTMTQQFAFIFLIATVSAIPFFNVAADETHEHSESEHTAHHDHPQGKENTEHKDSEKKAEIEASAGGVGPGKAVVEASPVNGMRLSDAAVKTLGLTFQEIETTTIHHVPAQSIVYHQADIGIYRLREGWIKLVDVEIAKKSPTEVTIKTRELKPRDQIAVRGVSLLRVTELDVTTVGGGDHD